MNRAADAREAFMRVFARCSSRCRRRERGEGTGAN